MSTHRAPRHQNAPPRTRVENLGPLPYDAEALYDTANRLVGRGLLKSEMVSASTIPRILESTVVRIDRAVATYRHDGVEQRLLGLLATSSDIFGNTAAKDHQVIGAALVHMSVPIGGNLDERHSMLSFTLPTGTTMEKENPHSSWDEGYIISDGGEGRARWNVDDQIDVEFGHTPVDPQISWRGIPRIGIEAHLGSFELIKVDPTNAFSVPDETLRQLGSYWSASSEVLGQYVDKVYPSQTIML